MKKKLCFVLMPFKETYRQVYDVVLKPTVEGLGYECIRADDIRVQRNIMRDVIELIDRADVMIADLTDSNPNVFYELGISHALARQTVVITQSMADVPFDLRSYRTILYKVDFQGAEDLKRDLAEALGSLGESTAVSNPVVDFLPARQNAEAEALRAKVASLEAELSAARSAKAAASSNGRRLLRGVDVLARTVEATFGPLGANVVIHNAQGALENTRDIVRIGKDLETGDSIGDIGVKLLVKAIEDAANTVHARSMVLLVHAMLAESVEEMEDSKIAPARLKRGLEKAARLAADEMRLLVRSLPLEQWMALDADSLLVRLAASVIYADGVVACEPSESGTDGAVFVETETLNSGYLNAYFITDPERLETVFENPYVLVADLKLAVFKPLIPVLEHAAKSGRPLLVIARQIEGEAASTMILNKLRGTVQVAAVAAQSTGLLRGEKLKQVAEFAGAAWSDSFTEDDLEQTGVTRLGTVRKAVITKNRTALLGKEADSSRPGSYRELSAILKLRAGSDKEYEERKRRVTQLLTDARRARNGLVPGGGVAFLRGARALEKAEGQDETAAEILAAALEEPARVLLRSAGADEDDLIRKMMASDEALVYDVLTEKLVRARESTILDPASTILQTLETAVNLVTVILTGSVLDLKAGEGSAKGGGT